MTLDQMFPQGPDVLDLSSKPFINPLMKSCVILASNIKVESLKRPEAPLPAHLLGSKRLDRPELSRLSRFLLVAAGF